MDPAQTSEELQALDRVHYRLALTKDEALEGVLEKLLPLLLMKLGLPEESIRTKVLQVLGHINKRVRSLQNVKLPCEALVELYQSGLSGEGEKTNAFTLNFAIVYIEMGFGWLSEDSKIRVAPQLLRHISQLTIPQQGILLRLVLQMGDKIHVPSDGNLAAQTFPTFFTPLPTPLPGATAEAKDLQVGPIGITSSFDQQLLADFLLDVLLFNPTKERPLSPGLSISKQQRILANKPADSLSSEMILRQKIKAMRLLTSSGLFSPTQRFLHVAVASCDTQHQIVEVGEEELRKAHRTVDFDSEALVTEVIEFLHATEEGPGAKSSENGPVERSAIGDNLRCLLLQYLGRSKTAANRFPDNLRLILNAIFHLSATIKLRVGGMQFMAWTFSNASPEVLGPIAAAVWNHFSRLLAELNSAESYGTAEHRRFREASYQAVKALAHRLPHIFKDDATIPRILFHAMEIEDPSNAMTVQETLMTIGSAYVSSPPSIKAELGQLVHRFVYSKEHRLRICAIDWTCRLFPFDDVASRYICLRLLGDESSPVRESARKGLVPPTGTKFPAFSDFALFAFSNKESDANYRTLPPASLTPLLMFAKYCFGATSHADTEPILKFWEAVQYVLEKPNEDRTWAEAQLAASFCLLDLMRDAKESIGPKYSNDMGGIISSLRWTNPQYKKNFSEILGHIASVLSQSEREALIQRLLAELETANSLEKKDGYVMALGHVLPTFYAADTPTSASIEKAFAAVIDHIKAKDESSCAYGITAFATICSKLNIESVLPLSLGERTMSFQDTLKGILALCKPVDKSIPILEAVVKCIYSVCKGSPTNSMREDFANFLVSLGEVRNDRLQCLVGLTLKLIGESGFSFSVNTEGETAMIDSIVKTRLGSASPQGREAAAVWLIILLLRQKRGVEELQHILEEMQSGFIKLLSDRQQLNQDVGVQGVALVRSLASEELKKAVETQLIHTLRTGYREKWTDLRPENETENSTQTTQTQPTQSEAAPMGLAYREMVFMASNAGNASLVYSFLLFSISTAEDALNRKAAKAQAQFTDASYLSLASAETALTTDYERILSDSLDDLLGSAVEEIEPYLSSLLPKIYRCRFDPNAKIKATMTFLWKSLVKDQVGTLGSNFSTIYQDLLQTMGSKSHREREAATFAASELLSGRSFQQTSPHLLQSWTVACRVLDDYNESVRQAAKSFVKTLGELTLRFCDPTLSPSHEGLFVVQTVLPFIVEKGLLDFGVEVRSICLGYIVKISKVAGEYLKPYLADLTAILLESFGALEPAAFQYAMFHSQSLNVTREQLETVRMKVATSGPLQEAVDFSLAHVDSEVLAKLVPKLISLVRSGVGMPTRVGTANYIVALTMRYPELMREHADKMLKALSGQLLDSSSAVKRANSSAASYLCRLAKSSSVVSYAKHICNMHKAPDSSQSRLTSAKACQDLFRYATSASSSFSNLILPQAYIAKNDHDKDVSDAWAKLWEEHSSGISTIRRFLPEIIEQVSASLRSQSWHIRQQGSTCILNIGDTMGEAFAPYNQQLLSALTKSIAGRYWNGQAACVRALVIVAKSSRQVLPLGLESLKFDAVEEAPLTESAEQEEEKAVTFADILRTLNKEVHRGDKMYKRTVVESITEAAGIHPEAAPVYLYFVATMKTILTSQGASTEEKAEPEGEVERTGDPVLVARAADCLGALWPQVGPTGPQVLDGTSGGSAVSEDVYKVQKDHASDIIGLLTGLYPREGIWSNRVAILRAAAMIVNKSYSGPASGRALRDSVLTQELVEKLVRMGVAGSEDKKYAKVRTAGLDCLLALLEDKGLTVWVTPFHETMAAAAKPLTSDTDPAVTRSAKKVSEILR